MSPLNLIVLYVSDLDTSHRFFSACGLTFKSERHGAGPLHYSAPLPSGLILELYPRGSKPATRTRLGFTVTDRGSVVDALAVGGWSGVSEPRDHDYGRVSIVADPDGNTVELVEPLPARI